MSNVKQDMLIELIRTFGMNFKDALVYDRIREELRIFCANHTVDEVYNTMFLDIVQHVQTRVQTSIERLGQGGIVLLNLVVPKPEIPPDIAQNYKAVRTHHRRRIWRTINVPFLRRRSLSMVSGEVGREGACCQVEIRD